MCSLYATINCIIVSLNFCEKKYILKEFAHEKCHEMSKWPKECE